MIRDYFREWKTAWNQFWFASTDPIILGVMRVMAASILLYTHLVWTRELGTFFGDQAVLPESYRFYLFDQSSWSWSHFDWLSGETAMWSAHWLGLFVISLWLIGFKTRWTGWASCFLAISYINRATGAQFGLDQINGFLCLYLALGNSGASFSVDRLMLNRSQKISGQGRGVGIFELINPASQKDVTSNISIRLIQVHMCVVYLFAGLGKLQGDSWWNGEAIWGAFASFEYQTLDMTWMADYMWLVNVMTFIAVAWEVSYAFLIWHRLTRPIYLILAVAVHLGIGLTMGMLTFGLIMIVGNIAFVPPRWIRKILGDLTFETKSVPAVVVNQK